MDYNKAIIAGRVTSAPELKQTPGGQSVTRIGVATNRRWTDKEGNKKEEVEFHNVVAWGKTAEIAAQFLQKGSTVLVEGRLATRAWKDKEGVEKKTTEIICENLVLGARPEPESKSPAGHVRPEDRPPMN